jgi:hypothetical protein
MRQLGSCCIARLTVLILALFSVPAQAGEALNRELAEVARGLKQLLTGRGQDAIAVGAFTGPARALASGGAGIKQALIEELKKQDVRVDPKATLEVKGDYLDAEDRATGLLSLLLKARVLDRAGAEVTTFDRQLFGIADMTAVLGTTVQLPPIPDEKLRDQKLRAAQDQPQVHLAGTRISAAPDSPYALEILVKSADGYKARAANVQDGMAFVPIKRGELYAIKFINDSPHDAAIALTIDGLSVFAFSQVKEDGRPKYSHFIVPAKRASIGGEGTALGWHIFDKGAGSTEAFEITEYARSASAELGGSVGDIGTITASFAAAWPRGSAPPADEPDAAARQSSRSGDATGRGPKIGVDYTPVERELGRVRAVVSVRYTR